VFALEELVTPSALFISELVNTCTDVLAFAFTTFDPAIILVIFLLNEFTDVIFLFNSATLLDKSLFYTERRDIYYENYF